METMVRGVAPKPGVPLVASGDRPSAADVKAGAPVRGVDVAMFRNLPGAGTPLVSASQDKTLGSMDPAAMALSKLETKGPVAAKLANAARFGTRVVGPTMWGVSVFFNVKLLFQALRDDTITLGSKVSLAVGTACNAIGFGAAAIAALPVKLLARVGAAPTAALTANKIAGLFGGIGGMIFNVINMIETMRDPEAKPAARFFAKLGFALGLAGFVFGTVALAASLPWMAPVIAKLPALLPIATKAANWLGLAGMAVWIGQMVLGKNGWLSERVKGTVLG